MGEGRQPQGGPANKIRVFENVQEEEKPDDRLYPNLGVVFKEVAKLQPTKEVYTIPVSYTHLTLPTKA